MALVVVDKAHLLAGTLPVVVQEKGFDLCRDASWVMRIHLPRPDNPGDLEDNASVAKSPFV